MRVLNPAMLEALFATESSDTLICLITVYDPQNPSTVLFRVCNAIGTDTQGNAQRLSATTDDEVFYGVISNGEEYYYIPLEITLPNEEEASAPRASVVMYDVTRYLTPTIRSIVGQPKVKFDLILASDPDTIEVSYTELFITSITYSATEIRAELGMIDYNLEPFPTHSFTPQYFPGLF